MQNKTCVALALAMLTCLWPICEAKKSGPKDEESLVKKAVSSLKAKRYSSALEPLRDLSQNYMISDKAQDYRLELMHAEYRAREFDSAAETANQFITMYPHERYVDYALYIRALSLYKSYNDWVPNKFKIHLGGRDIQPLNEAKNALEIIMTKFPQSRYTYRAGRLLGKVEETIAQRDFTIAQTYYDRNAYLASLERLNKVVKTTKSDDLLLKSLTMMSKNYKKLGMHDMQKNMDDIVHRNWARS